MFGVKVKIFSICRYPFYKLKSCKQECAPESPIYYYFVAAVCEFSLRNFTEWQGGSSFLCSYCYPKPKDKQMLHLASFKIAVTNSPVMTA